jgi:pimeloyl-ACP methyl ester carboxylesterase
LYLGDVAGLGRRLSLVLIEPRGTDGSERPVHSRAYGIGDYVADVEELRAELGLEKMNLLGHSHGGVVAIAYAAAHPERVERLILASTLARFGREQEGAMVAEMGTKGDEPWYEDARAALEAEQAGEFESDEELAALVFRELPFYFNAYGKAEQAYVDTLRAETPNADTLLYFNREIFPTFDLRPDLARIGAPTLVITGERDFITGPVCAEEIADGIVGAELVILPGVGHFVFVEARDRFRAEVERFLAVA